MNKFPMRPEYKIKDNEMLILTEKIFKRLDVIWRDVDAYDISLVIKKYAKKTRKV